MAMKSVISFSLIAGVAASIGHEDGIESLFEKFISTFNKKYTTPEEKLARFKVFSQNAIAVTRMNLAHADSSFSMMNRFADLTAAERHSVLHRGYTAGYPEGVVDGPLGSSEFSSSNEGVDYAPCLPTPRDQGMCGSCWAFATASVAEGFRCKHEGKSEALSVQELLDCDDRYDGCEGADSLDGPLNFVVERGLCRDEDYPYKQRVQGKCFDAPCRGKKTKIPAVLDHSGKSQQEVIEALETYGPQSVGVSADFTFMAYERGVLRDGACESGPHNHAVTLVGYEMLNGRPVFKIRNTWGPDWGEKGHIRLEWGACGFGRVVVGSDLPGTEEKSEEVVDDEEDQFIRM